jgi:hypothetical protein
VKLHLTSGWFETILEIYMNYFSIAMALHNSWSEVCFTSLKKFHHKKF